MEYEVDLKDKHRIELCELNIQVLESMDDWVRVIDKDGIVIFINKSMKESCNTHKPNFKCSFDTDIFMGDSVIPRSVSLITLLTKKNFVKEIIFMGREYSVKSSPIVDDKGEVVAAVEVFRDISSETHIKRELFNANKRMLDDLKFARSIQTQLLPEKGMTGPIEVDYYYKPSEQLSGDLFDVIRIDKDKVGVYICDVVGHGVGASMLTMFIKQTMMAIIQEIGGTSPSKILYELRHRFGQMKLAENLYFTLFYGIYDHSRREFSYSNAGHNCCPILKLKNDYKILETNGVPICDVFKEMRYNEDRLKLSKGDKLIFYTDGFTEPKNYDKEEFGIDRFIKSLMVNDDIIENVVGDVIRFSWGEINDDMAIMVATIVE
ncbi:MAG: SpoIIE family protein phosphatase [Tissierellia bacterium]|nr:SpoIIE family protein phosphatase [Tissierellia bacterium]